MRRVRRWNVALAQRRREADSRVTLAPGRCGRPPGADERPDPGGATYRDGARRRVVDVVPRPAAGLARWRVGAPELARAR